MPWYRVAYRPDVMADLTPVEKTTAQRLLDKTKWLASNAGNLRHEPVSIELPGLAKYAVAEWRIFYSVDTVEHVVDIHAVARGSDAYTCKKESS
jgi:mRNA interferase RelE/StbE